MLLVAESPIRFQNWTRWIFLPCSSQLSLTVLGGETSADLGYWADSDLFKTCSLSDSTYCWWQSRVRLHSHIETEDSGRRFVNSGYSCIVFIEESVVARKSAQRDVAVRRSSCKLMFVQTVRPVGSKWDPAARDTMTCPDKWSGYS